MIRHAPGEAPLRAWSWSVAFHAAVLAAIGVGWWRWQATPAPAQPLAIEATVVESSQPVATERPRDLPPPIPNNNPPKPEPLAAKPPEVAPSPVPVPDPEVNRAAEKLAAEKVAAEKTAAEKAAAEKAEAERAVAEKAAAAKEAAEKLALSQQQARERELRERLAAEERRVALSASAAQWQQALRAHIERQWRRPPSAATGLRCVVWVDQVSGGEVVSVRMGECNGDEAVRQSIESAVYRASPLPPPPDPALFERRLELIFAPND